MDEIVKAALRKWPNVPHCWGWLSLDARGDWYMRDDRVQAQGPFPRSKGSRIEHEALKAFIHRNIGVDETGRWFFQNGPQRVFIELANTPWVWRVGEGKTLVATTGQSATVSGTGLDEQGHLYALTELGLGLVHTQDMWLASERLLCGEWPEPDHMLWGELPQRFGFVRSPLAQKTNGGQ